MTVPFQLGFQEGGIVSNDPQTDDGRRNAIFPGP